MSTDPSEPLVSAEAVQPPKQGMTSGSKVLIILAIVFVILALLCCGSLALFTFFSWSYVGEAVSMDPAVVRNVSDRIVAMDVPEQLRPVASLDIKVPMTDKTMMTWVTYADESQQSMLVIASVGAGFTGQNEEQMRTQMEQSLRSQGMGQQQNVEITERYERSIQVRGEPVTFFFGKGQDPATGQPRIEATGTFQSPEGMTMLIVYADEQTLDEEQIVAMIESIE